MIDESDGAGVKLVNRLDDGALQRVFDLDIDRADEFRTAAARHVDAGYVDADQIGEFARHADNLEGIDGLNSGPVDDFVNAGQRSDVTGALREVEVADDIGTENIKRMNIEVGPNGETGELDIKTKSGNIVEVKNTFGKDGRSTFDELKTKLTSMREHPDIDLDDNTLRIRADDVKNIDDVKDKVDYWTETVRSGGDWGKSNIHIEVVDDSANEIVARS